jgi:hypothetical protein
MSTRRLNDPRFLKGYWPLNSHTSDVSGNANDGTQTSLTYTSNPFGGSVGSFNGSTSKVDSSSTAFNVGTGSFSVCGWFKVNGGSSWNTIISKGSAASSTDVGWALSVRSTGVMHRQYSDGTNGVSGNVGSGSWNDGVPHFAVLTIDKTNSLMNVYVDGVLISSASISAVTASATSSAPLSIGTWYSSVSGLPAGGTYLNGSSWGQRFYSVVLTNDEVLALYNMPTPKQVSVEQPVNQLPIASDATLVGAWLNKSTVGTINDFSSNAYNGTLTATGTLTQEKVGASFSSVAINIGAATRYIPSASQNYTFSVWAYPTTIAAGAVGSRVFHATGTSGNALAFGFGANTKVQINTNAHGSVSSTTDVTTNQWYHLVMTFDGTTFKGYINGQLDSNLSLAWTSITATGNAGIGGTTTPASPFTGTLKDFRVYSEAKSPSWVSDQYKKSVPDNALLLHLMDGDRDLSIYNRSLTNTLTVVGDGMKFDGADSVINTNASFIGTSALTVTAWINMASYGESNTGRILDSSATQFRVSSGSSGILQFLSDGATTAASATGSISEFNRWYYVAVTRDAAGVANIYINGVLSGTANQSSGTPSANSTVYIGNNSASTRTFNGSIKSLKVFNEVKAANYIKDYYLITRKYF